MHERAGLLDVDHNGIQETAYEATHFGQDRLPPSMRVFVIDRHVPSVHSDEYQLLDDNDERREPGRWSMQFWFDTTPETQLQMCGTNPKCLQIEPRCTLEICFGRVGGSTCLNNMTFCTDDWFAYSQLLYAELPVGDTLRLQDNNIMGAQSNFRWSLEIGGLMVLPCLRPTRQWPTRLVPDSHRQWNAWSRHFQEASLYAAVNWVNARQQERQSVHDALTSNSRLSISTKYVVSL